MVIRQHGTVKVSRQAPTPSKSVETTSTEATHTTPVKKAAGTEGRKIVKKYNTSDNV